MTPFELYFCVTILRGALSVLFLLGMEFLLQHRLSPRLRKFLWAGCILLLLIPQMAFSSFPLKLDLSSLRTIGAISASGNQQEKRIGKGDTWRSTDSRESRSLLRAAWHQFRWHSRNLELGLLAFLPLPALSLLLWRYLRCRNVIRTLPPVTDRRLLESWRAILLRNGTLHSPLVLLDSSRSGFGPMLFGGFRRKLLLPVESLCSLPDKELNLLLEHEYHHSRAGDPLWNLCTLFLWALIWYNPFMRIARRRFRLCCELACDRNVLDRHPESVRAYGNLLLRFATSGAQLSAVTLGLAESPCELAHRIRGFSSASPLHSGGKAVEHVTALLIAAFLVSPICLLGVNVKQTGLRSYRGAAASLRPVLPHLILKPLPFLPENTSLQGWEIVYPETFPSDKSRLVMEIGETRLETSLRNRPRFLLLQRTEAFSQETGIRLESANVPPAIPSSGKRKDSVKAASDLLPAADDRPVYAALSCNGDPVAIFLYVDGIGKEDWKNFRPVSVR